MKIPKMKAVLLTDGFIMNKKRVADRVPSKHVCPKVDLFFSNLSRVNKFCSFGDSILNSWRSDEDKG